MAVSSGPPVRAAGGIIGRRGRGGTLELALVHRPRYDDWSFPKGKADRTDGSDLDTARREVLEETGLVCTIGPELGEVRYRDSRGRDKVVRYWWMEPAERSDDLEFEPNDEVDELRWCTRDEAVELLTYAHDRELVTRVPREEAR